jgi:hypothetical protein
MIDPISSGAITAAPMSASPVTPAGSATGNPKAATSQAVTRVYVDRSKSGVFVYRLVDVTTGDVLVELPRTASELPLVLDGYAPGVVASASV